MCGCASKIIPVTRTYRSRRNNSKNNKPCKYKLEDLLKLNQNNPHVKSAINILKTSPRRCNLLNLYIDELVNTNP